MILASLAKNIDIKVSPIHVDIEKYYPENNTKLFNNLVPEMVKAIQENKPLDNCPHCNFKPLFSPNSTSRDLIIIQAGGDPSKAQLSIKSLRSTGCKARIFLVITDYDEVSVHLQNFFDSCGVDVFRYKISSNYAKTFFVAIRFSLDDEFLYQGAKYVDRILYFDSFDTVFQSDPFIGDWQNNSLYVSNEHIPIGHNPYMTMWFRGMPNFNSRPIDNNNTICSGIFGATADVILKVGQLMHTFYLGWDFIALDQALYNYLIYIGLLEKAGINVELYSHFASIAVRINDYTPSSLGQFSNKINGFKPAVIHQYNRNADNFPIFHYNCFGI